MEIRHHYERTRLARNAPVIDLSSRLSSYVTLLVAPSRRIVINCRFHQPPPAGAASPERVITMSLDRAVTAMAAAASDDVVGLVIRWNQDDSKVRTLWSEQPRTVAHAANPDASQRPSRMFRYVDDNNPNGGIRSAQPVADVTGYHAEEIMISCWPALIQAVGLTEDRITSVDLVLSKSPCCGDAGSSVLIIETGQGQAHRYNQGCAKKLVDFCGSRRSVTFKICYIAVAGAHAGTYALDSLGTPGGNKRFMTAEEALLDPHRINLAKLEMPRAEKEKQRADTDRRLQELKVKKDDPNTLPAEVGTIKAEMGPLGKKVSTLGAAIARTNAPINKAKADARIVSLYQAQIGIAQLQRLVNVDVMRWGFAITD